jgi:hypothetical protein
VCGYRRTFRGCCARSRGVVGTRGSTSRHKSHRACRIVPVEAWGTAPEEVEEVEEVEGEDKDTRIRDSIIGHMRGIKAIQPPRFRIRTRINHVLDIRRTHTPRLSTLATLSTSHTRTDRTTPVKHLRSLISPVQHTRTCRQEMPSAPRDHLPTRQINIQLEATGTATATATAAVDQSIGIVAQLRSNLALIPCIQYPDVRCALSQDSPWA